MMSKTKKEIKELKQKFENLNEELKELSGEELEEVTGGVYSPVLINGFRMIDLIDTSLVDEKDGGEKKDTGGGAFRRSGKNGVR